MGLDGISEAIRQMLDAKNGARERALPLCRRAIRASANAIRSAHRHEREQASELMDVARECLDEARAALAEHPDVMYAGFLHDAAKEYAEARITFALVFEGPLPSREEVGTEAAAYLNGMGEAIGELRRHLLDLMRHGNLERCEQLLGVMDDMFYVLVSMDYPDAVTGGLRRTADVARSIIERTRGDLTTALIQERLRTALSERE